MKTTTKAAALRVAFWPLNNLPRVCQFAALAVLIWAAAS